MLWLALTPLLLLHAAADVAGASPEPPPRWALSLSASTATPAVLPEGLGLGAGADVERRFRRFFLSARLDWTQASAANVNWIIDHHQFVAALGGGLSARLGAGRVWAQAGAGATGLYEVLSRHQLERIDAANVPGGIERSLAVGPYAFGELGVGVRMRGMVSGFVAAGPMVSRTLVSGSARWRAGGAARLGVAYEF